VLCADSTESMRWNFQEMLLLLLMYEPAAFSARIV
jgi:hypothetical protein